MSETQTKPRTVTTSEVIERMRAGESTKPVDRWRGPVRDVDAAHGAAPAVVKRGGGAGRTSVSQSVGTTGHFFRLHLRPWCPGSGHNQRIL